jgi:FixJ family two-component response regulator
MLIQKRKSPPPGKPFLGHEQYGIANLPLDDVAGGGTAAKPRLLLLTDDPQVQRAVTAALAPGSYQLEILPHPDELRLMAFPPSPTCVLCSHLMRNGSTGFDVLQLIRERGFLLPTLFLAADWSIDLVVQAVKSGADDFLTLPLDSGRFRAAVEQAVQDAIQRWDLSRAIAVARARVASLDKREREVVRLVLNGFLNKEIANHLNLALVTVKVYRARAMKKMGAGNAPEMVRVAGLAGICNEEPITRPE